MLGLKRLQFPDQCVVVGVGDYRGIVLVIRLVMATDLSGQPIDATGRIEPTVRRFSTGRFKTARFRTGRFRTERFRTGRFRILGGLTSGTHSPATLPPRDDIQVGVDYSVAPDLRSAPPLGTPHHLARPTIRHAASFGTPHH